MENATVTKIRGGWNVVYNGRTYYMNRFGVVLVECKNGVLSGTHNFAPYDVQNAVQKAVHDAGYTRTWNASKREYVWSQRRTGKEA